MLHDMVCPTDRRTRGSRLAFGNPGFFLVATVASFVLAAKAVRPAQWLSGDLRIISLLSAPFVLSTVGCVVHVLRWRAISSGQRIAVCLLGVMALFSLLVFDQPLGFAVFWRE